MPTRNVSLTDQQDELIEELVESGEYQNASEAIRDAIRLLQQRRREDALRLRTLRARLKVGVAALEAGDFVELDESELERWLTAPSRSRRR